MSASSIIRTSEGTSRAAEPTVEIVTDGRVGAEAEAQAEALRILGPAAALSFRKSEWGELRFYYVA